MLVPPRHLGIVGPGLIGRSVALAARRAWPDVAVTEVDAGDPLAGLEACDLIVLAAPVGAILDVLAAAPAPLAGRLVLDVGSTKRAIVAAAARAGLPQFVATHPMAGAAASGAAHARPEMFDDRAWFVVRGASCAEACARATAFITALGGRPIVLDDDGTEHDRVMAAVSHLPQVVASTLMTVAARAAGERGLAWAGGGLRDTTRLASSSAAMWASVLASNADAVAPLLRETAALLDVLADRLADPTAVGEAFAAANAARAQLDAATQRD